jgi:hypothetical protein
MGERVAVPVHSRAFDQEPALLGLQVAGPFLGARATQAADPIAVFQSKLQIGLGEGLGYVRVSHEELCGFSDDDGLAYSEIVLYFLGFESNAFDLLGLHGLPIPR